MPQKTLFILDDDPEIANIISTEARHQGFEIKVFTAAQSFLDHLSISSPSHLAIDLVMPSVDGLAILNELIKRKCKSSIIFTSGIGSTILPAAQLAAIQHRLNVRGTLNRPFSRLILKNMLSDLVSVDVFADSNAGLHGQTFDVDASAMLEAIQSDQFVMYFQPQINLVTGQAIGFEGLMRWNHPSAGIKLPETFIPIAEETGVIDQLTEIAIAQGFAFIKKVNTELSISLNISARSIHNPTLFERLNANCRQFKITPRQVILELTETTTMQDPEKAEVILNHLRKQGFRLSIDDFGTGYSSMAQLAHLPFTELKIDKSFVTTMEHSPKSIKVIASTINLAESLGMASIAEGIENSTAAIALRELGCLYGQGYYFARPMEPEAALHWLENWRS